MHWDIGGFYGPAPEEELLVRWIQNGIFQPRFSVHSTNTDNTVTEPWMYGESKAYIKNAMDFRYQLSPYLYSLLYRAHQIGLQIMESMYIDAIHREKAPYWVRVWGREIPHFLHRRKFEEATEGWYLY